MVVRCDFKFANNPSGVFYAGQNVRGKITIKLDKPMDIKAINLRIKGFAKTSFKKDFNDSENLTGYEEYILQVMELAKPEKPRTTLEIQPGKHVYDFDFQLPQNCPSTLKTENGKISYSLKLSIERPWKLNQNSRKDFTVFNIFDLNAKEHLALKEPLTAAMEKTFGFSSSSSMEPLSMLVSLPHKGFLAGQNMPINLVVDNASQIDVEAIKITFFMIVNCLNIGLNKDKKLNILGVAQLKGAGVLRHSKKVFDYQLALPSSTPATTQNECEVIKINYELHVEATVKGLHLSPVLKLPITIGCVPSDVDKELHKNACGNFFDARPPSYEEVEQELKSALE